MVSVPEIYGTLTFDDRMMREYLSERTYESLRKTIEERARLDIAVANEVAEGMKRWALERGATHFTHWFQPLSGVTAEKHDSFISPSGDGSVMMEFSGKELISGESDASSFPSGGLRATFEARGYTAWDPTSYAFIKGKTLCIPTAFCSYSGQALDKKTPLLRSMEALNRQALRVLRLFGDNETRSVRPMVGTEQEYFLIDGKLFSQREDLRLTGRTLFGAPAPKSQEMDDHYYGAITPRVEKFMEDLDLELWKLGIPAKTEHNEVAPSQHELALLYDSANLAADQNQLTMEMLQKTAAKHGMVCLLHEKPFRGLNGSGKHNNWSLETDGGYDLLTPGDTPYSNARFLLFLCAVIKAADGYQDLLRLSVATAGNDCRLGALEAPPAVVSVFLGDELGGILDSIEKDSPYSAGEKKTMRLGVDVLPKFPVDTTDRNRTSPLAFTGNKFEFRMPGSSDSVALANTMLNASVARALREFADALEGAEDFNSALHDLIRDTVREHKRIIFNGNGYDESWIREAVEERGLANDLTTPDCIPKLLDPGNVELLTGEGVFTEAELIANCVIMLDNYCKTVAIEAGTMADMVRKQILPAIEDYSLKLADLAQKKRDILGSGLAYEKARLEKLDRLMVRLEADCAELERKIFSLKDIGITEKRAVAIRDGVLPLMDRLREAGDCAERLVPAGVWPFPTYSELLFSV